MILIILLIINLVFGLDKTNKQSKLNIFAAGYITAVITIKIMINYNLINLSLTN